MGNLSAQGRKLLISWEGGCALTPYPDQAGLTTIGVGHLLTAAEKKSGTIRIKGESVPWRNSITRQQALDLLAQDIAPAEHAVNTLVKVPLTQNQFDALVSFAFNCGDAAFAHSTLLKVINAGTMSRVPEQMSLWNKAGGKVCPGLVARRKAEIALWKGDEHA